jgi:conjugative transfer signal peptidase TraF
MLLWQPHIATWTAHNRIRRYAISSALGAALLALSLNSNDPVLVYNPSHSAPIGYYLAHAPTPLKRGDWVLVDAPLQVRQFAGARGYLPVTVPMIKSVVAMSGDTVCAQDTDILINGMTVATRLRVDHRGRPLPWWNGCRTLGANDVFLLNRLAPGSFDGRYFGVLSRAAVRNRLVKL